MPRILPALICATLALLSTPALAQEEGPPCAPYEVVAMHHAEKFGETRIAQAVMGDHLMVVFATPGGETWSIVLVDHQGVGCLRAIGTDWQARSDPAPVPEEGL
jgi:hypothetical protein